MNVEFSRRIPVIPLVFLWLTYALLGWHLSDYHIVWLVGAFVVALVLSVIWKSVSWLESLIRFGSQTLIVVFILSISIALIATWWLLFTLFLLPLTTTMLADLELRFANFNKLDSFLVLLVVAGLGLGIGEMIDIVFLPSLRY